MYIAQKPCSFAGQRFKIGETIPEGLVHEKAIPRLKKGGILAVVGEGSLLPSATTLETVAVPILADEGECFADMTIEDLLAGVRAIQMEDEELLAAIETIESGDTLMLIDVFRGKTEEIHKACHSRAVALGLADPEEVAIPDTEEDLMKLTRAQLVEIATGLGMEVTDAHHKKDLVAYILENKAGSAE